MSTNIASIAPLNLQMKQKNPLQLIPLSALLNLNKALKKTVLSRKFYQEISDKVLSSASTIDANLYFLCYLALLVSSILNNKPKIRHFLLTQRYNLIQVLQKVSSSYLNIDLKNSSNKSVAGFFNTPKPVYKEAEGDEPVSKLAVHLKSIYSYISDVRIFNRLFDSIKYMPWIIDEFTSFIDPAHASPKADRFINLLQSLNCLVLELLENAGWLTDHNWVGTSDNNYWCIETYIWCSRVWGLYIFLEIVELFRRVPISKWDSKWRISVFKQAVQLPMAVHWSLYEGCVSPFWIGALGCGASWFGFRDLWKSIDLS